MRKLAPLLVLLVISASANAAEQFELENGLRVILDRRPTARAVQVTAVLRTGRALEPDDIAGASHFVEHMMFRATKRRPAAGSDREIWRVGGRLNAFTREDYTEYGILLPSSHLDLGLDILSDAILGACFLPEEVEEERRVVLEEIKKRDATPETWAYEQVQGLTFLPHPYGRRIIGSARTVGAISRDRLLAYWRNTYRPDRATIVLVGDVDRETGLAAVRKWFGEWWAPKSAPRAVPALSADRGRYQEMTANRPGASPALFLSAAMPPYLHPDYLPSRFLKELLTGWLVQRLVVEKRVAKTAEAYYTSLAGRNLLRIRLSLPDADGAARARDELLALLFEMASPEFEFGGIEEVGQYFASQERLLGEDFERLASVIARAEVSGYYSPAGRPEHLAADDRYSRVGAPDLARVAAAAFTPANLRVLFLLPPEVEPPAAPDLPAEIAPMKPFPMAAEVKRIPGEQKAAPEEATPPRASDAVKTSIPDGPRLLQLERRGVPVVSGCIVIPAGSRYDATGKEGLAALTMTALSLATRGDESGAVRWRLYAMGNNHSFATDRDTSRIIFTVPAADLGEALQHFARMLSEPAFTEAAVAEARGRLLREVQLSDERIGNFAGRYFRSVLFDGGPYSHERFGIRESILKLTREDLVAFHGEHYRPERAVVSLVGEFSPRHARRLVEQAFRGDRAAGPTVPVGVEDPGVGGVRTITHPSGRAYVIIGALAAPMPSPLFAEASLLRLILGWEAFEEFTDRRSTAYEAGSFYDAWEGAGPFGLYVATSPKHATATVAGLKAILDRAVEGEFDEGLIEDSRGAWLGGLDLSEVRSDRVAYDLARRETLGAGFRSIDKVRERVEKLTAADLKKACRAWFTPGMRLTIQAGPLRPEPE